MKTIALTVTLVGLSFLQLSAQTAQQPKVDVKPMKVREVQTPQFQASNVGDRNWRPKNWLEVDVEFEVKATSVPGGRNGSLSSMMVNYYLGMAAAPKDGKFPVIKGSITYVNIPAGDKCHALGFVPPGTLRAILEKDTFTANSDIKAYGFEVMVDGTRVAGESSTGKPFWDDSAKLSFIEGAVLPKQDTPFAILWGDYDVPAKSK